MVMNYFTCHHEAVKQPDGLPGNSLGQRPRKKRSLIRRHAESVRQFRQPFRLERMGLAFPGALPQAIAFLPFRQTIVCQDKLFMTINGSRTEASPLHPALKSGINRHFSPL